MSSQQKLLIFLTEAAELLDLTKQQLYEHSRSRITHKLRQRAGACAILPLVLAQREVSEGESRAQHSAELNSPIGKARFDVTRNGRR